jgi:DNA repair protein RadC
MRPKFSPTSGRYRMREVRWTVVRESGQTPLSANVSTPEAAYALVRTLIPDDDREHFLVLMLNAQNYYIGHFEVSTGTQSASLVHPREVFGPAIRDGACSLVLAHNHPSGDPTPSREDLRLTRQLVEAAKLLDIRIHDHVIVGMGSDQNVSLAQRGAV